VETSNAQAAYQLIVLIIFVVPAIFFLISQQKALKAIKPENRLMQPGLVWLSLIPIFTNFWQFFVVIKIAGSAQAELASRHTDSIFGADALAAEGETERPTQNIGITYCVLEAVVFLMAWSKMTGVYLQGLIAWAMIICWIIYWVQLARIKNKLKRRVAVA